MLLLFSLVLNSALPVLAQNLKVYKGNNNFNWSAPKLDKSKKTIIIVADNDGTEMFDLIAPFYLFNATNKTNVLIVAEKKAPVLLVNSLFLLPHYTFSEIDSLNIKADVIVLPNVTIHLKTPPKKSIVDWVKKQFTDSTIMLSICDGSATAAATGIYNGKPITTHASDFNTLRKQFPKANWIKNVSVTESDNLYSTAGVSNAVEGSLVVIKRLFGEATVQSITKLIGYPNLDIKDHHQSTVVNKMAIFKIATKVVLRKNSKIGVLMTEGIDEFWLASILDTYVRSFPKSINSISLNAGKITSKYGLTLFPTADLTKDQIDEMHVLGSSWIDLAKFKSSAKADIINYPKQQMQYPIETCLERIAGLYGSNFKQCVKLMLDYN
jgi:putative intracellular protease/amidase